MSAVALGLTLMTGVGSTAAGQADPFGRNGVESYVQRGAQYLYGDDERVRIAVNVWGEIARPGSYLVPDDTDLVTLLSLAGGPASQANLREVMIVSFGPEGARPRVVDIEKALAGGGGALGGLHPGDTVSVPRRASANWGGVLRTLAQVAVMASSIVIIVDQTHR